MKKKLILGFVISSLVISNTVNIFASGTFTKYVVKDASHISKDPKGQEIINDVRNLLPMYGQMKMDMMAIYFTDNLNTKDTEGFGSDDPATIGFASVENKVLFVNSNRMYYEDVDFHQTAKQILAHEVGHAIDYNLELDSKESVVQNFGPFAKSYEYIKGQPIPLNSDKHLYSSTKQFISIWQEENRYMRYLEAIYSGKTPEQSKELYAKYKANDVEFLNYVDRYISGDIYYESDPVEFWAESVSLSLLYPEQVKSVAPKTFDYIQRVLNQEYEVKYYSSQARTNYQIDFFISTKNKEILKQLIHVEHDYLSRHSEQTDEIAKILGDDAKEYINSNIGENNEISYEDYLKKKYGDTNNVQEPDGAKKPEPNGETSTNDSIKDESKGNKSIYDKSFENYFGWVKKDGKWYYIDENGRKAVGWYEEDGKKYYFNDDGSMKTGLLQTPEGNKVYYDDYGSTKKKGWLQDGNTWYYLNADGTTKTGWIQDKGTWYYLDDKGAMKTGWINDGGTWYFLSDNGSMKTGWIQSGDKWYYLNNNGSMAHDTTINGYTVGSDGAWIK